jgi:terminase, large subunit
MNFKNSWMAEEWVEQIEAKKEDELAMHRIELAPVICPPDTLALTCGVDPGQGGFWYVVLAWTKAFAPHLVQHGFLLDYDAVRRLWFENVYQVKNLSYPIKLWRRGMDTGGSKYESESETMTAAAYEFLRTCDDGFTFGTKGQENMQAGANMQIKRVDSMPGPKGRPIPGGLPVWFLRPSYFKNVIQMRLNVKPGDPGRFTFNESVGSGSDYIKHLRGEVKQKDRKTGKWEWVPVGPNHLLDATVIAFALADPECFGGVRVLEPLPKEDIPEEAREEEETPGSAWITGEKRKGGWI